MSSVIYVEDSKNSKISSETKKVDCTYAPIEESCPSSCDLKKNGGCYALYGYVGIVADRIKKEAQGLSAIDVAKEEALAIDNSYNAKSVPEGKDLRLHISGDSRTKTGTKIINDAVGRWKKRGGGSCWTYTHAWRTVPRSLWSNVSTLASITNTSEVKAARQAGYAPAIVVSEHISDKMYSLEDSDVKWIPCPAQTRDVSCVECKLCFNSDRLFNGNYGIAFAAHGVGKGKIKRHLAVIK